MAFDKKHYPNRKDKRKPYRGPKAVHASCRNHGSCDWCRDNRLHADKKRAAMADGEDHE